MSRTNRMIMSSTTLRLGAIALSLLILAVHLTSADEFFGYNEEPENIPGRQNARNRTPIYIPGKCGTNEILYPGDQENDWVCDCRPAHVYHPSSAGCFALFTQAYCAEGEYVEIKPGSKLPQCTKNVCKGELVPYNGTCVKLHANNDGACPKIKHIRFVIGVNEETLQLECVSNAPINLNRGVGNRHENPNVVIREDGSVKFLNAQRCAPGSAAWHNGTCTTATEEASIPVQSSTVQPVEDKPAKRAVKKIG